jgi:glucose/arabinose dehydrogenase
VAQESSGGVNVKPFMSARVSAGRPVRVSTRRGVLVALVALGSIAGTAIEGATPSAARAGQPPAAQCQQRFLDSAAGSQAADPCTTTSGTEATVFADLVPAGFQESTVWSGLVNPTAVRFAADGRVFVAEKSGVIKIFDDLSDPTPTTFSGLTTNVHNFWDRGLLGLALDPSHTGGSGTGAYLYVLYAYDHILGDASAAPRWGDGCATPPGPTTDGCVISGRLSRFAVSGNTVNPTEQVLIEDWCQQFPSHSVGSLAFGPDGALYLSAGDGASFNGVDYGQLGGTTTPIVTQKNPCTDPPADGMSAPTAEGGALRSQDVRTQPSGGPGYPEVVMGDTPLAYYPMNEPT